MNRIRPIVLSKLKARQKQCDGGAGGGGLGDFGQEIKAILGPSSGPSSELFGGLSAQPRGQPVKPTAKPAVKRE